MPKSLCRSKLPLGWLQTPNMGKPIGILIPMKVPINYYHDGEIPSTQKFTPRIACEQVKKWSYFDPSAQLSKTFKGVGLVIDLSISKRFYHPKDFQNLGVLYKKLLCSGHKKTPNKLQVNTFVHVVRSIYSMCLRKGLAILVHCTHGFNRSGFMIISYWLRFHGATSLQSLATWLNIFATSRPPGIYKHKYIAELFKRIKEKRSRVRKTKKKPLSIHPIFDPSWLMRKKQMIISYITKYYYKSKKTEKNTRITDTKHNKFFSAGDRLCPEEKDFVKKQLSVCLLGKEKSFLPNSKKQFLGSHPVSLDRLNSKLLLKHNFNVTCKADGTRYLLVIDLGNVYLIDRKMDIVRVTTRFLTSMPLKRLMLSNTSSVDALQPLTLIDGEMVIDEDAKTGIRYQSLLMFDLMHYKCSSVMHLPFYKRYQKLQNITLARNEERTSFFMHKYKLMIKYDEEPFRLRRKDFYDLFIARKLLKMVTSRLDHESDGLIFQGRDDPYILGSYNKLIKWKPANLNSVDLLFKVEKQNGYELFVLGENERIKSLGTEILFLDSQKPINKGQCIIECTYDKNRQKLIFIRVRTDKVLPNGLRVYKKIMKSIEDDITDEELLRIIARKRKNQ